MRFFKACLASSSLFLMLGASGCASAEKSAARRLMRVEARAIERQSAKQVERQAARSVERQATRSSERQAIRGAERQSARSAEANIARTLDRDLARDRATTARRLSREATAFRYTSKAEARRELRSGIRAGSHFTSRAGAGRPLGANSARARYGLPRTPEVRETVQLQKGSMMKRNRALGGGRGVGEITSTGKTTRTAIRKVIPLKQD
ncbi:MAG: hypothetical protein QOH70_1947 [Blastocatellia bacterium]|nr:hypothetical protein [Blastocatellia bacterium]